MLKICTKCKLSTEDNMFYKKETRCINCCKQLEKEYRLKNKDKIKARKKQYYLKNRDKILEKKKNSYKCETKVGIKTKQNRKAYYLKNRDKLNKYNNEYRKKRKKHDFNSRLSDCLRSRLRQALKAKRWNKSSKLKEYIGCTLDFLRSYLESKFTDKMNWGNYGEYWHIDHIIPLSSVKSEEDLYKLSHYTNLQPLDAVSNRKKSNKY